MKQLLACVAGVALGLAPRLLPAASGGDVEVRAYVNDSCIVADEPYFVPETAASGEQKARALPLLGIVVGKAAELLIKYLVGHATDRIRTAGGRRDTYYGATRQMNLFRAEVDPEPVARLNSRLGCMTIVAAKKYQADAADCTGSYLPRELAADAVKLPESEWHTTRSDDSVENKLRRANICLDGQADAVYEARFEFSEDGTAYRLHDAGYHVNALQTAPRGTPRSVFYTIEIAAPGQKQGEESVISTAWVNLGSVNAGAHRDAPSADSPSWLHVPPMSPEARRAFEQATQAHHELAGEIAASKRAISRDRRVLEDLQRRIAAAPPDMAAALGQERQKVEVRMQVTEAEAQANAAEYAALPRRQLEFMPVSIRVGVTESRSEKAALLAMATVVNEAGGVVASMGGDMTAGLVSRRSIDPAAQPTVQAAAPAAGAAGAATGAAATASRLETARAAYYDRLVDFKAAAAAGAGDARATEQLADAKLQYNSARREAGLEPLP